LLALLTNFGSLVSRICAVEQVRDVYYIPMTDKGERLIQQLGFRLIGPKDERVDQHPLYVATLKDIRSNIEYMLSTPTDSLRDTDGRAAPPPHCRSPTHSPLASRRNA